MRARVTSGCRDGGHTLLCEGCHQGHDCPPDCICVCHCPDYDPTQGGRFRKEAKPDADTFADPSLGTSWEGDEDKPIYGCDPCGWHGERKPQICPMCHGSVRKIGIRKADGARVFLPVVPLREGVTAANARLAGHRVVASIPDDAILETYETHKGRPTRVVWRWAGGACHSVPCYTTPDAPH